MELLDVITQTLDAKKANDIKVVNFRNENPLCDYFVICDAPSLRQVNALAMDVEDAIYKAGFKIKDQEHQKDSTWVLLDAIDVVVHIFETEDRKHYNLEKLYQDYLDENVLR